MATVSIASLNALVNYARMTIDSDIFLIFSSDRIALALLEEEVFQNKNGFVAIIAESKNYLSIESAIDEIYNQISAQ